MDERIKVKNLSAERYKQIDRRIKKMCKEKKEEWINRVCRKIDSNERRDTRAMEQQIRKISGKKRTARSTVIKSRHENMLADREDVLEKWKESYIATCGEISPTTGKLSLVREF